VLIVITNYTGDRLTFGVAMERARIEGIKVEMVVVGEDCALTSAEKTAGRRGLAGTVLMHKIAGALAEEGKSLEEMVKILNSILPNLGTMGMAMSPCSLPGAGPMFKMGSDELEIGLGLHGEAGVKKLKMKSSQEVVTDMIDHMTNPSSVTRLDIKSGDHLAVLLNNLGGTTNLEMNIIVRDVIRLLESRGMFVDRIYMGGYITSLEMAGMSISILKLKDNWVDYLDKEGNSPAWKLPVSSKLSRDRKTPANLKPIIVESKSGATAKSAVKLTPAQVQLFRSVITSVCKALMQSEEKLNLLDSGCGDGDCGTTLKNGSEAVLAATLPLEDVAQTLDVISQLVEANMGGTSGGLYSLFLAAASRTLADVTAISLAAWSKAVKVGVEAIMRYGRAEPGDRTLLDALYPACVKLEEHYLGGKSDVKQAMVDVSKAALEGAQKTSVMKARAGRASYVSQDRTVEPDAGATAVAIVMEAISSVM
jgi:dihydroxyacetone kinase